MYDIGLFELKNHDGLGKLCFVCNLLDYVHPKIIHLTGIFRCILNTRASPSMFNILQNIFDIQYTVNLFNCIKHFKYQSGGVSTLVKGLKILLHIFYCQIYLWAVLWQCSWTCFTFIVIIIWTQIGSWFLRSLLLHDIRQC